MTDKVQKIKDWVSKTQDGLMDANGNFEHLEHEGAFHILSNLDYYIDSLQEEPVSEDLEEAAWLYYDRNKPLMPPELDLHKELIDFFKAGAEWQKEHLWKDAQGDDLPEIDREVIALLDNGKVAFAHRPYKGKYIGKSLTTGNIETFENQTYDKGEWNIPDVKYWLDVELPKETEL